MFTKQEWKQNLTGCMEIFLFMPVGIERFSPHKKDAIKSLIIPLLLLPITLVAVLSLPEESEGPLSFLILLQVVRTVGAFSLFLLVVYYLAKQFGRQEHFFRYLNAGNWCNIPGVLLTMPLMYGIFMGHEMAGYESYAVFITLVGYVYSAFILTYSFRLPWEMGGFIAIVGLAINENLFDLTHFIKNMMLV